MPTKRSLFKTPALEKQYMELYDAILALWNVPYKALDVHTSFGTTHINTSGPKESPALLLLPGFGANSTMWFPNVAALTNYFLVYAVDTNGQPGKSLPTRRLTASNSSEWITEIIDSLGLKRVFLAGVSLGGWLALKFAIQRPECATRVVLLDPAASFEKMSTAFLWHSFLPIMVYPTRNGLVRYFRWMTRGYKVDQMWGELMLQGILNTLPQAPIRAATFTEAQLRNLQTPILLLVGENSVIYDPHRVYRRARELIPHVKAQIVPNASHALNAESAEYVNTLIIQFCREESFKERSPAKF